MNLPAQLERRRRAAVPIASALVVGLMVAANGSSAAPSTGDETVSGLTVGIPAYAAAAPAVAPTLPNDDTPAIPEAQDSASALDSGADASTTSDDAGSSGDSSSDDSSSSSSSSGSSSGSSGAGAGAGQPSAGGDEQPEINHVFLITLSDQGEKQAFEPADPQTYLAKDLVPQGTLLSGYQGVTRGNLANAIALVSGQGPTPATQANCPTYADVGTGQTGPGGQELGAGCVYSAVTGTIFDQLKGNDKTWAAYIGGMGPTGCRRPAPGAADPGVAAAPGDDDATWRDPLVYFHSIADSPDCAASVRDLSALDADLKKPADKAPALSYITPSACADGSDTPCRPGAPAGLGPADAFLGDVIPKIGASKAYADGGLIVVTFDRAASAGPDADFTSCCLAPDFPNVPKDPAGAPAGGGVVGALLISPLLPAGDVEASPSNHFDLLASLEDLFGLPHLGYAADKEVTGVGLPALAARLADKEKGVHGPSDPLPAYVSGTVGAAVTGPSGPTGPTGPAAAGG